jgi:DNA-binding NarL/FixJ family response regulator
MPNSIGRTAEGGIRIALVDSIPLFREGLSALALRTRGLRWTGAVSSPHTALQLCTRLRPQVVLVDSGLDPNYHLCHMLTGADPDIAVLALVQDQHKTTRYVAGAVTAGVHGMVLRTVEPPQLVLAIHRVHIERRYVDPGLATTVLTPRGADGRGLDGNGDNSHPALSKREYQVLQLIADGLENQAIANTLFVSVETVRTHVKSILRKLSARDRTHAVAVAFRSGVLLAHRNDHKVL